MQEFLERRWQEPEWVERTLEESAAIFVSHVHLVKPGGKIRIFEGDPDPRFYRGEVVTALRDAKSEKGAHITVMTGPIISHDDETARNGLLELANEGVIDELAHRSTNDADRFYWLVEKEEGYEYQIWHHIPSAQP